MKRTIMAAAVVMMLFTFSEVSFSETRPSQGMKGKEITPENFSEVRSDMLQRIEERMKRLNEEQGCVQAATNAEELKKCRPSRSNGPGLWEMQRPPK